MFVMKLLRLVHYTMEKLDKCATLLYGLISGYRSYERIISSVWNIVSGNTEWITLWLQV